MSEEWTVSEFWYAHFVYDFCLPTTVSPLVWDALSDLLDNYFLTSNANLVRNPDLLIVIDSLVSQPTSP